MLLLICCILYKYDLCFHVTLPIPKLPHQGLSKVSSCCVHAASASLFIHHSLARPLNVTPIKHALGPMSAVLSRAEWLGSLDSVKVLLTVVTIVVIMHAP